MSDTHPHAAVPPVPLHLFEGFGVELEYMIVNEQTLAVMPAASLLLQAATGQEGASDFEKDGIGWSNELVNHLLEFKTDGPVSALDGLDAEFAKSIAYAQSLLKNYNARLMPTAMHPWMDPATETHLWPYENSEVYRAFDRIFNCQGHGWSNLQSVHINLPFADDEEFARLHAAVRLLLPILPALAASSPLVEGQATGWLDNRLDVYRSNCAAIPSITGKVIPEPVYSRAEYEQVIFEQMYRDIAPHDPDGVLHHEWLNARGAIARFDRGAIEIRVLDLQECPRADVAICRLIVAVLQALIAERWGSQQEQQAWAVEPLHDIFLATIRDADDAAIANSDYLAMFGLTAPYCSARELWLHLAQEVNLADDPSLRLIFSQGCLARRIVAAVGPHPDRKRLAAVYQRLCDCLVKNEMFQ